MKTLIAIIFLSQIAQASILNSKLEPRHQSLIEQAVFNSCGQQNLIEQSVMEKVIRIIKKGEDDLTHPLHINT